MTTRAGAPRAPPEAGSDSRRVRTQLPPTPSAKDAAPRALTRARGTGSGSPLRVGPSHPEVQAQAQPTRDQDDRTIP